MTFAVEIDSDEINCDKAFVAGSFNSWKPIPMRNGNGSGVYTLTMEVDRAVPIEYKTAHVPHSYS